MHISVRFVYLRTYYKNLSSEYWLNRRQRRSQNVFQSVGTMIEVRCQLWPTMSVGGPGQSLKMMKAIQLHVWIFILQSYCNKLGFWTRLPTSGGGVRVFCVSRMVRNFVIISYFQEVEGLDFLLNIWKLVL